LDLQGHDLAVAAPEVSAVVVVYRSADCIGRCLDGLVPLVREGWLEVIVVDNASPDDSAARVERDHPEARLVRLPHNLGFAGGVNAGLRVARGRQFVLVNPDVVVEAGTLTGLADHLHAHPSVAAVGPRVVRPDGAFEVTASYRPTFANQVTATLGLFLLSRWVPAWKSPMVLSAPAGPLEVDVVTGCLVMIPRWAYEAVGPFDEDYFMYVEDVDWCVRARDAGYQVHYLPHLRAVHDRSHGGTNASLTPMDGEGNIELFFRKHRVPHSPLALRWVRRLHHLSRAVWMLGRWATGRRGAGAEAMRHWLALTASFRRTPPTARPGGADVPRAGGAS
jgi:GT2 family glycosyltransferase